MTDNTQEKLAKSLTAETTELLPYLPYLLQDFWELGSSPQDIAALLKKYAVPGLQLRTLDLGCGKGAVSVHLARALGARMKGIDLIAEFIAEAKEKALEHGVDALCVFETGDINEAVERERGYDCTILGAVGNVLGTQEETLAKLKGTVRRGGFIIIDDAYLAEDAAAQDVRYANYEYPTLAQWQQYFAGAGLTLLECLPGAEGAEAEAGSEEIRRRADELAAQHPDKAALFEGYVQSQLDEYYDLEHTVVGATWILQLNS